MIIYNYITTNLVNGRQYIGMHSTNNVDDDYLGSGFIMLKAIKKWGKINFKRTILCICQTLQEANENEAKYIKEYNTLYPKGYNLSPTGGLGFKGCHSEEAKRKMIGNKNPLGTKRSEETKEKMRLCKIGNTNGFKKGTRISVGRKASEETRKKKSESMMGVLKGRTMSEETKKKMRERHADVSGKNNPNYGKHRVHSEETKRKISEAGKRRYAYKHETE